MIFTQRQYKERLSNLEGQIIAMGATPTPDTRDAKFEIFGMAAEKVMEICEKAPKGQLMKTLAMEHLREEQTREGKAKPAVSKTPLIDRIVAGKPLVEPRPAASSSINAQSLAAALIDEQERRAAAAKIKTREQFTAMSPKEQSLFCRNGGKLTD